MNVSHESGEYSHIRCTLATTPNPWREQVWRVESATRKAKGQEQAAVEEDFEGGEIWPRLCHRITISRRVLAGIGDAQQYGYVRAY